MIPMTMKHLHKLADVLSKPKKKTKEKPKLGLPRYVSTGPKRRDDKTGPGLQGGAPELLETFFRSLYSCKEIKETLDSVTCPENCDALKSVMINKEIYSRMQEKERKWDEPMKFIANGVAKASQLVALVWNTVG